MPSRSILRLVLQEMLSLCQLRDAIEQRAATLLADNADAQRLRQIPGIGPITALTILAEAGAFAASRITGSS